MFRCGVLPAVLIGAPSAEREPGACSADPRHTAMYMTFLCHELYGTVRYAQIWNFSNIFFAGPQGLPWVIVAGCTRPQWRPTPPRRRDHRPARRWQFSPLSRKRGQQT